ncbi:hypothetical protein ACFL3H_00305 [Gemmatimonadota bacterium]
MDELDTIQELSIVQATDASVLFIQEGLRGLNTLSAANDFYQGPLQLLSQGYEQLMKVVLILFNYENDGSVPTSRDLKNYGHNLTGLLDTIIQNCRGSGYPDTCQAAQSDIHFMNHDQFLRELLTILTDFGEQGRYYYLESIVNPEGDIAKREDPLNCIYKLEQVVLDNHPEWKDKIDSAEFSGFYSVINKDLTTVLQRLARALCRLFTMGPLGGIGKQLTGTISAFLFLSDGQLKIPQLR